MLAAMLTLPAVAPARADRSNARSGSIVRARSALSQFDAGLLAGRGDPVAARPQSSPSAPRFGFAHPFGFRSALVGSAPVGQGPSTLALNPATHTIYVANGYNDNGPQLPAPGNTVSVIDTRRCQAQHISSCKGPWPTIRVGSMPSAIAIDERTDTVYVSNVGDNTVSVFNGATCDAENTSGCAQAPATVPVGLDPLGILADPVNHTVYVPDYGAIAVSGAQNSTAVSMLDSATCNATDLAACPTTPPPTVDVGASPDDVDVDRATHTVYVTTVSTGDVGSNSGWTVFDASTCNATTQSGCGRLGILPGDPIGPNAAQIDPANNTLYTANYDSTISAFDLNVCNAGDLSGCATDTPGTVTPFAHNGIDHDLWVAVNAPLHTVYAVYQKDDALLVVNTNVCNGRDPTGCATLDPPEIHTGSDPESVALDPLTQTLYTANQVDNDVSVIDATRCNAETTIGCRARVPEAPIGSASVTADPPVATAYIVNGNNVSMIDTRTCNAHYPARCSPTPPTMNAGANPVAAAVDPATHTVYVADVGTGTTGTISVFDDRTCNATHQAGCATVSTLDVPDGIPVGLAVNPRTDTIYVATITSNGGPNLISVFDGSTCNATTATGCSQTPANAPTGADDPVDGSTESVAVNATTNTIYATSDTLGDPFVGHSVYVIDGPTCDAADMAGCPNPPEQISVGSDPVFGEANPFGIAVDQATDTIYTANIFNGEGPGTVSVINGATCNAHNASGCGQTPATAPAGFGVNGIAVDPINNRVYATNIQDTSVTTINGNACNSINRTGCDDTRTQATVGDYPSSISVDSAVDTAYVADIEGVSLMALTHRPWSSEPDTSGSG